MSTKIVRTLQFPGDNNDYRINAEYLNGLTAEQILATNDALLFKGALNGSLTSPGTFTPAADAGHVYKVATSGWINGQKFEVGDTLICTTDSTPAATMGSYIPVLSKWVKLQNNIDLATTSVQGTIKLGNTGNEKAVDYRAVKLDANGNAYTTESPLVGGVGIKVTNNVANRQIDIDNDVVFVFNCGNANTLIDNVSV